MDDDAHGQPALSWDEAGRRLDAARARAIAAQPRFCPACSSDDLAPLFDPSGDFWSCEACGESFEVKP